MQRNSKTFVSLYLWAAILGFALPATLSVRASFRGDSFADESHFSEESVGSTAEESAHEEYVFDVTNFPEHAVRSQEGSNSAMHDGIYRLENQSRALSNLTTNSRSLKKNSNAWKTAALGISIAAAFIAIVAALNRETLKSTMNKLFGSKKSKENMAEVDGSVAPDPPSNVTFDDYVRDFDWVERFGVPSNWEEYLKVMDSMAESRKKNAGTTLKREDSLFRTYMPLPESNETYNDFASRLVWPSGDKPPNLQSYIMEARALIDQADSDPSKQVQLPKAPTANRQALSSDHSHVPLPRMGDSLVSYLATNGTQAGIQSWKQYIESMEMRNEHALRDRFLVPTIPPKLLRHSIPLPGPQETFNDFSRRLAWKGVPYAHNLDDYIRQTNILLDTGRFNDAALLPVTNGVEEVRT